MYEIKMNEYGLVKFDNKKVAGVAIIQKPLTDYDVDCIVSGALEGGIGYWAKLDNTGEEWKAKPKEVATSEWTTVLLLNGHTIRFFDSEEYDEESDDNEVWTLTLEGLINGVGLNTKERPHDANLDYADSTTYDCIFQYGMFGELVYG